MKFEFIDDARKVLRKAWSARLSLLAGVLATADAAWQTYITGQPPVIVCITALFCFGSALARIIAQPELHQ